MKYEVLAKRREGYPSFRRAGIAFSSETPIIIDSETMEKADLQAILSEPMLIIKQKGGSRKVVEVQPEVEPEVQPDSDEVLDALTDDEVRVRQL